MKIVFSISFFAKSGQNWSDWSDLAKKLSFRKKKLRRATGGAGAAHDLAIFGPGGAKNVKKRAKKLKNREIVENKQL